MKLTAEREMLLAPLQAVIGVVERRQTMPVLANVLLSVLDGKLTIAATDLEVELVSGTEVAVVQSGDITVPGRKFLEILRALPEKSSVSLVTDGEKVLIKAGRSRFSLSTWTTSTRSRACTSRVRTCCDCWRRPIFRWHSRTFAIT